MNNFNLLDKSNYFSEINLINAYLYVEGQMALAQAEAEIIPTSAAKTISRCATLKKVKIENIERSFRISKRLIFSVAEELAKVCGDAGRFVHWGGTSQNIVDTGYLLILKEFHGDLLDNLSSSIDVLTELASKYSTTPLVGRTLGQNALPISFGFKIAGWIEELIRADNRFRDSEKRVFSLCCAGPVGAFHGFFGKGHKFSILLAKRLKLNVLTVPNRVALDLKVEYIAGLCFLAMTINQISKEILFMMSQNINELSETQSPGQIGSSAMPHKINPHYILEIISKAQLLRGKISIALEAGISSNEADLISNMTTNQIVQDSCNLAAPLMSDFKTLFSNIIVNTEAMAKNLESSSQYIASGNLMLKLATFLGTQDSHRIITECIKESILVEQSIVKILMQKSVVRKYVTEKEVISLLDPKKFTGESKKLVKKTLRNANNAIKNIKNRREKFTNH